MDEKPEIIKNKFLKIRGMLFDIDSIVQIAGCFGGVDSLIYDGRQTTKVHCSIEDIENVINKHYNYKQKKWH